MGTSTFSIFQDVVSEENKFTELFRNYLKFDSFRLEFLNLIEGDFQKELIRFASFDTQFSIKKHGQPDIVCSAEDVEILFEIKITPHTTLTDKQPKSYLQYLNRHSNANYKALILIIPCNYLFEDEYEKRVMDFFNKNQKTNIITQTIYWEAIIEKIEKAKYTISNPIVNEYQKYLKSWFSLYPTIFTHQHIDTMFNKKFPSSLSNLFNIIENICRDLKNKKYIVNPKRGINYEEWDEYDFEYGFYIPLPSANTFWFGMWMNHWQKTACPLSFGINYETKVVPKNILNKFNQICVKHKLPRGEVDKQNKYITTYFLKDFLVNRQVQQNVVDILDDFCKQFQAKHKK